MLDQLKELAEMQRDYDNQLLSKIGKKYDYEIEEKMIVALFVELGELMQEMPSHFKFWKKKKVDNREKALEEYVDALKCSLSLFVHFSDEPELDLDDRVHNYNFLKEICEQIIYMPSYTIDGCVAYADDERGLSYMLRVGVILGFEWQEIYEMFKKKHAINLQRLNDEY